MKQITKSQAKTLALADQPALRFETSCCQVDWIKKHAREIAEIETKLRDKTNWGDFPKGWRHEMVRESKDRAEKTIVDRFIRENCCVIDGSIWLGNWHKIQEMTRP
jgi:hypothetical protein